MDWKKPVSSAQRSRLRRDKMHSGLCTACKHLRLVTTDRSYYVRCFLAEGQPAYRKYPQLPVVDCAGFSQIE